MDPGRRGVQEAVGLPLVLVDLLGHGVEVVQVVPIPPEVGVEQAQEALLAERPGVGLVHPVHVGRLAGHGQHLELPVPVLAAGIEALDRDVGVGLGEAPDGLVVVRDQGVPRVAVQDLHRHRRLRIGALPAASRGGGATRRQDGPPGRRQPLQHQTPACSLHCSRSLRLFPPVASRRSLAAGHAHGRPRRRRRGQARGDGAAVRAAPAPSLTVAFPGRIAARARPATLLCHQGRAPHRRRRGVAGTGNVPAWLTSSARPRSPASAPAAYRPGMRLPTGSLGKRHRSPSGHTIARPPWRPPGRRPQHQRTGGTAGPRLRGHG